MANAAARRPTLYLLLGSMVTSAAAGVITAMLLAAGQSPTAWIIVPLLTFIAFSLGAQSLRAFRDEVVTDLVDFRHRKDRTSVVPDTLANGDPL